MNARTTGAAIAAVVLLAGCATGGEQPAPYVTEHGNMITVCGPISGKDDTMPGRWAFEFRHDGGWVQIPVNQRDYGRYQVGDVVRVQQQVGQLGTVRGDWCRD